MVVDTKLYDLLGVSPDADDRTIKKAFMMKAKELHPDKNRDDPHATEKFQAVNEAYEIIKDPQKRANYDRFGPGGLKGVDDDHDDILSHIFGFGFDGFGFPGFGRSRKQYNSRPQRTADITYDLHLTLEQFYSGIDKQIKLNRHKICPTCKGNGTKNGQTASKCHKCNGTGQVQEVYKRGPMQVISTNPCPVCKGSGEYIPPNESCPQCHGEKSIMEKKPLTIHISPGMEDGERIRMSGEADEVPGYETGDLIVILRELKHKYFKRNHENLLYTKQISWSESLLGYKFTIPTLDGRTLVIEQHDKITNTGDLIEIREEGMPKDNTGLDKGNLFVYFDVIPMKSISEIPPPLLEKIREYMPPKEDNVDESDPNVFRPKLYPSNVDDYKSHSERKKEERRREAYQNESSSDDERYHDSGCQPM